jgi:nitrogen-specific signal transduction histidine kinase
MRNSSCLAFGQLSQVILNLLSNAKDAFAQRPAESAPRILIGDSLEIEFIGGVRQQRRYLTFLDKVLTL